MFAGEHATIVRDLIAVDLPLILCLAEPAPDDRELLLQCGASEVIAPRAWSPGYVAERILAECILAQVIQPAALGTIKGATQPVRNLYHDIQVLAPLEESVLILGETGTGKELVAHELHAQSGRSGQFFPINCPAISRELLPSELFGHEKGAFTNAVQTRKGLLVEAGKGTGFLDEIGDLDLTAQAQLLRVLEERRILPVGSNKWVEMQARLVMATNRDLEQDCAEGKFRPDLYMRLKGFTLNLPPLRECKADLLLLAHSFVQEYNQQYAVSLKIPPGALDCLFQYEWPGNIRELRAVVRKAAAFADKATGDISHKLLLESIRIRRSSPVRHTVDFDPLVDSLPELLERAEKQYLRAVMNIAGGHVTSAAKHAGISRSQFYEKLKNNDKT